MIRISSSPATRFWTFPRRICCLALLALALALPAGPAWAEISFTDDAGREVRLPAPARRVIALSGALNEIVAALGREDALIARTEADREPPSILGKPAIGTHLRPNLELVAGLAPDLVIQLAGRSDSLEPVEALSRLGIPVAVFRVASFEALFGVTQRLGELLGAEAEAKALTASLTARLDRVQAAVAALPRPRVLFEVRYPNLLLAGRGSIVSEVVARAGGENCLASTDALVRASEEEVVRLNPEVYLMQRGPMNPDPVPLADRPQYRDLAAIKSNRVFVVDEQRYSRPGPRLVDAVEELAGLLHPDMKADLEGGRHE